MTTPPALPGTLQHTLGQHRVVSMEGGRATIEYDAGMQMCHSGGVVQGGFVSGWIDAAMAHAAISLTGRETSPMSLEMKVSYFAPARPGRLSHLERPNYDFAQYLAERTGGFSRRFEASPQL